MSPEGHGGPESIPHPSQIPSLEELQQSALQATKPEAVETPPTETETEASATPEVQQSPESPHDPLAELVDVKAETEDLRRALRLDWYAMHSPIPADTPLEERPTRVHSVQLKGHPKHIHHPDYAHDKPEIQRYAKLKDGQLLMVRPEWETNFPADPNDKEQMTRYEAFKAQFPITTQANIEALRATRGREAQLLADPEVKAAWERKSEAEREVLQVAGSIMKAERRADQIARTILDLNTSARRAGRELTAPERAYVEQLQQATAQMRQELEPHRTAAVTEELRRRDVIEDGRQLRQGLLETEDMKRIINMTVPSLAEGKPLLLFGETGGAKTALAKHMAREYLGVEPELISGHAEVNAYQVMGKTGLRASGEATETVFNPGPLYTAMAEGKPIILDEIDAMPASFLIRLNYILQLRPGDHLRVQEDSNQDVEIKPGFCIIATANMKSARYQREKLDPAFMQRFRNGAGVEHVQYPDANVREGGLPRENLRLAMAYLIDERGRITLPRGVDIPKLTNLLKAAHASQRMFTEPASVVGANYADSQRVAQGRPALDESVLAPREWMGVLDQVKNTGGGVSLEKALARFVSGQNIASDREVISKLLATHNLLGGMTEEELRIPPGSLGGFRREPRR